MPQGAPPNLRRGGGPRNSSNAVGGSGASRANLSRLSADLIHGPDFLVPYIPSRPSVLTLHDLSPWLNEDWHADAHRVRRRTPILLEMGVATMVIAPSEPVRKQAIERFRLRPDRVVAISEAAAPWFVPVDRNSRDLSYFLFRGHTEPRRVFRRSWMCGAKCARTRSRSPFRRTPTSDAPPIAPSPACNCSARFPTSSCPRSIPALWHSLPVALRRLWTARTGSDAVRRARDCIARSRGSGRRGGDMPIPLSELAQAMRDVVHPRRTPAGMA